MRLAVNISPENLRQETAFSMAGLWELVRNLGYGAIVFGYKKSVGIEAA